MIGKIFSILMVLVMGGLVIFCVIEDAKHMDKHRLEGYEAIGVIQTSGKYGDPYFYKIVKYKDGCEGKIKISGNEYFEYLEREVEE